MLVTTEKALVEADEIQPRVSGEHPKSIRACPRCQSLSVAHSRIRGAVGQMARRLLRVRPYRCLDCWHRFFGITRQA